MNHSAGRIPAGSALTVKVAESQTAVIAVDILLWTGINANIQAFNLRFTGDEEQETDTQGYKIPCHCNHNIQQLKSNSMHAIGVGLSFFYITSFFDRLQKKWF